MNRSTLAQIGPPFQICSAKNWGRFLLFGAALLLAGETKSADRVIASNYTDRLIATGGRFDGTKLAAAHKTLPLGTQLTLSYGHQVIVVTVNDRGPYIRGRTLDLTPAAKKRLRCSDLCRLKMDYWPPLPKPRPYVPQTDLAYWKQ